jgi:hypothetical protein
MSGVNDARRRWLAAAPFVVGASAVSAVSAAGRAAERMPGDPPEHRLVYQLNRIEPEHVEHVLGSIGAMIAKYEDNVALAVVAFGPGLHLLGRRPGRPVPQALRERARAQAKDYGVRYIACGNTMGTLGWTADDIVDYARIEDVGAATLMEMQEAGWAYIAW